MSSPRQAHDDGERRAQTEPTGVALSRRELEVLGLARLGHTNATIAEQLGVSSHTVKFHLASCYRKLGAVNRTDAMVRWLTATAGGHADGPGPDRGS
jgi:DNA-binding CsgD family transcriptional regulator